MLRLYVFLAALGIVGIGAGFFLAQSVPYAAEAGYGVMVFAALAMIFYPARRTVISWVIAIPLAIITWSMLSSMAAQLATLFDLGLHPVLADILAFNLDVQTWLVTLITGQPETVSMAMAEEAGETMNEPGLMDGIGGRIAIDVAVATVATLMTGLVKKVLNIGGSRPVGAA
ncbi:MAG: hypothetical protein CMF74_11150 [Maricaulis sp.]|jgi:hypothetical protein|nr:hypothetical protein [Maricaulis sp.]HAQ34573.1 hypothetical protein [Alphaproteobacteria bacterium]|tara:strand:+ start:174 stop:689 length:516 start_codon:yes stop_codon:yes gene_type:complete